MISEAIKATKTISLRQWLPIGVVVILATFVRLYQINTESLWIDEMLSIRDSENFQWPFPYLRPFYYALLNLWMQFGSSDTWLRTLSVVFGVGGVLLTYLLGKRIVGESTGLSAALIISLSPLFINHAQEIRMYTLISFLSLAGTLALTHALEKPTYTALGWWTIARTLLLITNANNVLIMPADVALIAWKFRKQYRQLFAFGIGLGIIGLFFLPPLWVLTFGGAADSFMEKQVGDYAKPGVVQIIGMLTQITVYWPLRYLLQSNEILLKNSELADTSLLTKLTSSPALSLIYYAFLTIVLLGLLCIPLINLFTKHRSEKLVWLTTWAFLPAFLTFVVSYVKNPIWFPRYLLFIAPYFIILVVAGFIVVWNWRKNLAIIIAALYLIGLLGGLKDYYTVLYRNDWQGAAKFISTSEKPNDAIVYYSTPDFFKLSLPRYYPSPERVSLLNKPGKDQLNQTYIQQELKDILPLKSRLWMVCWLHCQDQTDLNQIFSATAGEKFEIQEHQVFRSMEFTPIQVFLVEPKPEIQ